jgi:hypothetical protein
MTVPGAPFAAFRTFFNPMEKEAMRIARTESLFRDVNERVAEAAERFASSEAEFVCECSDGACTERVETPLEEYERVRADGVRFLLVPGHEDTRVERVVRARRHYAIVEKFEHRVAAAVRRLNPRAATS